MTVPTSTNTPRSARYYLDVPFPANQAAKAMGVLFDPEARKWWVADPQHPACRRWKITDAPHLQAGRTPPSRSLPAPAPATSRPAPAATTVPVPGTPEALTIVAPLNLPPVVPLAASPYYWLDVPEGSEQEAIALGATRHSVADAYWVDHAEHPAYQRWGKSGPMPSELVGEDRTAMPTLVFDLGSDETPNVGVKQFLSKVDWMRLRRMAVLRAGKTCELCGAVENLEKKSGRLSVLGRWAYDEDTSVKTLARIIVTCDACYRVTERGLATGRGIDKVVESHLFHRFGLNGDQVAQWWSWSWLRWLERRERTWTLDLSLLTNNGLTVLNEPVAVTPKGRPTVPLREPAPPAVFADPTLTDVMPPPTAPAQMPAAVTHVNVPAAPPPPRPLPPTAAVVAEPEQKKRRRLFGFGR